MAQPRTRDPGGPAPAPEPLQHEGLLGVGNARPAIRHRKPQARALGRERDLDGARSIGERVLHEVLDHLAKGEGVAGHEGLGARSEARRVDDEARGVPLVEAMAQVFQKVEEVDGGAGRVLHARET